MFSNWIWIWQVYIGADTDDSISKTYNKSVYLENTLGAQARALSLANNQIVKFTVPHIRFPKGSATFDGVSKSQSWTANTNITAAPRPTAVLTFLDTAR